MSPGGAGEKDWELYLDWCAARDIEPLPVTGSLVAEFVDSISGRPSTKLRLIRSIRSELRARKLAADLPGRSVSSTLRSGEGWADVPRSLSQLPTLRFPSGLRGRRDGVLIVMIGVCGLSRAEARRVSPSDVSWSSAGARLGGCDVGRSHLAGECPSCAVSRWLEVLPFALGGDRATARSLLDPTGADTVSHVCADAPDSDWAAGSTMLPAIDRHGWAGSSRAMSLVTISSVMKARQRLAGAPAGAVAPREPAKFDAAASRDLAGAYDEVDHALAELIERTRAVLAEGADLSGLLTRLGGGRLN